MMKKCGGKTKAQLTRQSGVFQRLPAGFTLVEVLIAISIFTLAAVISSNILVDVVQLEKKSSVQKPTSKTCPGLKLRHRQRRMRSITKTLWSTSLGVGNI